MPIAESTLKKAFEQAFGESFELADRSSVQGGCINQTERLRLKNGRSILLKTNRNAPNDMFAAERAGLDELGKGGQIRVPRVFDYGTCPETGAQYLIMEFIPLGPKPPSFSQRFGEQLATLHRERTNPEFGFQCDNYLGSTPQPNPWTSDWVTFWRESRLLDMRDRLRSSNSATSELLSGVERLAKQLPNLIGSCDEPPTLIHGDLWSGNYLVDDQGKPVLIDPAVYFGKREAELAMTELFGGFDRDFYQAYDATWPLAEGHRERIALYKLHHLMNHLLLFGSSYHSGCMQIIKQLCS